MSTASRPLLPPATPLLRAGPDAVQIGGVDSTAGLRISPADAALAALLRGLDGSRTQAAVLAEAQHRGLPPDQVAGVLDALRAVGLLLDLDAADLLGRTGGPAADARAAAELTGVPGSTRRTRGTALVVINGATRVGVPLAAVLAASGVGRVSVHDPGTVAAGDVVVGGLTSADEGRPRNLAAADAVRRASPLTDLRPPPPAATPDLVVLARPWAGSDPLAGRVHRSGTPHLVAAVRGETGIVGPLVVPGRTGCLRCADLHRRDEDPAWPVIAAQLTATEPPASGSTLICLVTAVTAAVQALAYLDGVDAPVTLDGTLELRSPDLVPRLRRWPPHPECGCRTEGASTGIRRAPPPPGGPTRHPPAAERPDRDNGGATMGA